MDELTRLALAAKSGDDEALTALIRATQADVWRLCAHLAGRRRADDLTQEVYLRAWRSLHRFEARSGVRAWLLAIARHTAIDALRAASRRPDDARRPPDDGPSEPDHADHVTTEQLLAGLEDDRRLAFFLTQLIGLSYAEAAAVCAVPVGTIRSRVFRARDDLATALGVEATS